MPVTMSVTVMMFGILSGGCSTTKVLTEAALAGCGTSTVYLSAWWRDVPDKSNINTDPMGGYQFAYWIDEGGNVCHGTPRQNGQVGPAAMKAYRPQAHEWATRHAAISPEQLKAAQEIPVGYDAYAGSGWHFVQFDNTIWRDLAQGLVTQLNSYGVVSIPTVIEMGSKACVAPVANRVLNRILLPGNSPTAAQDPNRCQTRALPTGTAMSDEDLKKYDVFGLPHGTDIVDVP